MSTLTALQLESNCLKAGAADEAQAILEFMISTLLDNDLAKLRSSKSKHACIVEGLNTFGLSTQRWRFVYQQITLLVEAGLPWIYFETLVGASLRNLVLSIAFTDSHQEADELLRAIFRQQLGITSCSSTRIVEYLRGANTIHKARRKRGRGSAVAHSNDHDLIRKSPAIYEAHS